MKLIFAIVSTGGAKQIITSPRWSLSRGYEDQWRPCWHIHLYPQPLLGKPITIIIRKNDNNNKYFACHFYFVEYQHHKCACAMLFLSNRVHRIFGRSCSKSTRRIRRSFKIKLSFSNSPVLWKHTRSRFVWLNSWYFLRDGEQQGFWTDNRQLFSYSQLGNPISTTKLLTVWFPIIQPRTSDLIAYGWPRSLSVLCAGRLTVSVWCIQPKVWNFGVRTSMV